MGLEKTWEKADSEFVKEAIDPANRQLLLERLSHRRKILTLSAYGLVALSLFALVFEMLSNETSYGPIFMSLVFLFYALSQVEIVSSKIQMLKAYDTMTKKGKGEI
jgi:hypothetical protein